MSDAVFIELLEDQADALDAGDIERSERILHFLAQDVIEQLEREHTLH